MTDSSIISLDARDRGRILIKTRYHNGPELQAPEAQEEA
jgi:hypothetical protein